MLEFVERKGTRCLKYDDLEQRFGSKDLLPMWVADMDCRIPEVVQQTLREHLDHGVYGYPSSKQQLSSKNAVISWLEEQHGVSKIQENHCAIFAGVLEALAVCIEIFCKKDEAILINSPGYNGFYTTIQKSGRKLIENYLSNDQNGNYSIDFDLIEQQIKNSEVAPRIFLFCSPHNPSGRVWNEQELNAVIRICQEYDMYLIVDEIHFDIVYSEALHLSILHDKFSSQYNKIIFLSAPSKTFNIASLRSAYLVSYNIEILKQIKRFCERFQIGEISIFGHISLTACYTQPEAKLWLAELLQHLQKNRDYLAEFLHRELPQLTHQKPQGTYLYWIRCQESIHSDSIALQKFFINAGLALGWGDIYHAEGWVRLNFACRHSLLLEALEKWRRGLSLGLAPNDSPIEQRNLKGAEQAASA